MPITSSCSKMVKLNPKARWMSCSSRVKRCASYGNWKIVNLESASLLSYFRSKLPDSIRKEKNGHHYRKNPEIKQLARWKNHRACKRYWQQTYRTRHGTRHGSDSARSCSAKPR